MNLKDKILEQQDILENYKYFLDKLELKENDKTFELYLKELMIIYVEAGSVNKSKVIEFNSFKLEESEFDSSPIIVFKSNLIYIKDNKRVITDYDFIILNRKMVTSSIFKSLIILLKKKLK